MKDFVKRRMIGAKWVLTRTLMNANCDPNERLIG